MRERASRNCLKTLYEGETQGLEGRQVDMNEGKMGSREMWVDFGELRQAGKKKVCCIHSNSVSSLYGETNKENICLQTPSATSVCVCV